MKILVLCSHYPDINDSTAGMFFHVRNLYYLEKGIEVNVINFSSVKDYEKDKIKVYSINKYEELLKKNQYDLLICHAPHISHHYKFLKKYAYKYNNIVFIFHGNEVFKVNEILSKEYIFNKKNSKIQKYVRNLKDELKLFLWKRMFTKLAYKSHFVFVSEWMREQFFRFTKVNKVLLENRSHIIYNSIGKPFEINNYDININKEYDFITIRNNIDGEKYGIDIVNELAESNPNYKFLIIGKGNFFNFYKKAPNVELINKELSHNEILLYLNKSRCGLLPTLWDSQGLMTCEFVSFGIPTITSDIPICHEILDDFDNVAFIRNDDTHIDLTTIFNKLVNNAPYLKNRKYFADYTSGKEVQLFRAILKGSND